MIYLPNSSRYPLKDYRKGKKKKTYKVIHKKPKKKKTRRKETLKVTLPTSKKKDWQERLTVILFDSSF